MVGTAHLRPVCRSRARDTSCACVEVGPAEGTDLEELHAVEWPSFCIRSIAAIRRRWRLERGMMETADGHERSMVHNSVEEACVMNSNFEFMN